MRFLLLIALMFASAAAFAPLRAVPRTLISLAQQADLHFGCACFRADFLCPHLFSLTHRLCPEAKRSRAYVLGWRGSAVISSRRWREDPFNLVWSSVFACSRCGDLLCARIQYFPPAFCQHRQPTVHRRFTARSHLLGYACRGLDSKEKWKVGVLWCKGKRNSDRQCL